MSENMNPPSGRVLHISSSVGPEKIGLVLKALGSEPRLEILKLLSKQLANVREIAERLNMPVSTAALHVAALEKAGLIHTELRPARRGVQKICARYFDTVVISLPTEKLYPEATIETSMPVGSYVDCRVVPTCGLASATNIIGTIDDPVSFYEPDRFQAQLLWFRQGYVEYRFPNRMPAEAQAEALYFIAEICSEAPLYSEDWPSDITLWINGVEVGTWTSPGDLGGQRGSLTPEWWEITNTQYGLLKMWRVDGEGTFVDGLQISDVHIGNLSLGEKTFISVRLGVKRDARYVGGVNLFGRSFGNYPQDLILRLSYMQA